MGYMTTSADLYQQRVAKVFDYVQKHLNENLSLETLSDVADISKYHFHRQFYAMTGINVSELIRLMRLKRASYQLVFDKARKIIDIAFEANFDSPESFTRAFKKNFGQTPTEFRKFPQWESWYEIYRHFPMISNNDLDINVDIREFEAVNVAVIEHHGSYKRIYDTVIRLIKWKNANGLTSENNEYYGVYYDDPETTNAEEFRFDFCIRMKVGVPENSEGIVSKTIPGGRCAVARHFGSRRTLTKTVRYLYGSWLLQVDEKLRDYPCFFHYVNSVTQVDEHNLITDVYLPLK